MLGRSLLPACALGLLVSCGGGKQAPAQAPSVVAAEPKTAPLPPLVKVAPPAELFAVARFPNVAKTVDTGITWSGLPLNWRSMLDKELPGLSRAAMLDAPIDFAAMLDRRRVEQPKVEWAFSIGVPSTDSAVTFLREQGGSVAEEAPGTYRVRFDDRVECLLVRALGVAPARVVCSDRAVNADALAPYMSCGMPTESFGTNEFHAQVSAEPFRRRYGSQITLLRTVGVPVMLRELSLDDPKFDRALRDVLYGLADEVIALAYDLDRLDLDASMAKGGTAVNVSATLSMSGQRSWWAQTAASAVSRASTAPETFWKLPADADSGSYSATSDPSRLRGIAAALRELVDGWLDYHKLPERRRTPLVEALEALITTPASTASVTLPDEAAVAASGQPRPGSPESVRAAIGEHLFALDQGGDQFVKLASEIVKSLGDRAFRAHLAKSNLLTAAEIPSARTRGPKLTKGLAPMTKVFELTIPAAALESASRLGRSMKANEKPAPAPAAKAASPAESVTAMLVAMPVGPVTWFAVGTDEMLLETRLAQIKAGTGATLSTRDGLSPLKTENALSAGFSSLAALAAGMRSSLGAGAAPNHAALGLLPHRGEAPLLWHAYTEATGPKIVGSASIPRELVEDLVAMAASSAAPSRK